MTFEEQIEATKAEYAERVRDLRASFHHNKIKEEQGEEAARSALEGHIEEVVKLEIEGLKKELELWNQRNDQLVDETRALNKEIALQEIHAAIKQAGPRAGLLPSALADALELGETMLESRDSFIAVATRGDGFIRGDSVEGWLRRCRAIRPHWFGQAPGKTRSLFE